MSLKTIFAFASVSGSGSVSGSVSGSSSSGISIVGGSFSSLFLSFLAISETLAAAKLKSFNEVFLISIKNIALPLPIQEKELVSLTYLTGLN